MFYWQTIRRASIAPLLFVLAVSASSEPAGRVDKIGPRAFPGAEGFGAHTPGGRGGALLFVTTIEDYLFELKDKHEFDLTFEDIDHILETCLDIAKVRYPQ